MYPELFLFAIILLIVARFCITFSGNEPNLISRLMSIPHLIGWIALVFGLVLLIIAIAF